MQELKLHRIKIIVVSLLLACVWPLWHNRYDIAEWVRDVLGIEMPEDPRPAGISDLQWAEQNYTEQMADLAEKYDVPYEYLMALAVLECSGNKPAGNRFEKHVYRQLVSVKNGTQRKFENIKQEHLANFDDEMLKTLATSWGPFQLMGYKAIPLNEDVENMKNEDDAAEIGAKWISQEYGHFLNNKKWKDAFHFHNTGKRFPLSGRSKTHDPYYVSDGLKYMKYFAEHSPLPAVYVDEKKKKK